MNIIRSVCEGIGRKFNNSRCLNYEPRDRTCIYLREQRMEEFWHSCRGAFAILYEAVNAWSKKFQEQYPGLPIDDAEDIDFQGIIARLNKHQPDVKNLNVWQRYVSRTVYLQLRRTLVNRGLLPRTHICGTCKHLTRTKPYICSQTQDIKPKTHTTCKDYRPVLPEPLYIDEDPPYSHYNNQAQNRVSLELVKASLESKEHNSVLAKFSSAVKMLNQRVHAAEPASKTRQKYKRQCEVFTLLYDLLSRGIPKKEAEKTLLATYQITLKTLQRDIADLKKFLQQKMSHDDAIRYPDLL